MNYTINIYDTTNNDLITSIEKAVRSGAILSYQGGDKKDDLNIISSALELSIIAKRYVDGYFKDLFTGNETKFRVEVVDDTDYLIWSGFILPDEYSEPYTNVPVVDFTASDGLGRLKGKYLPDEYYSDEKSFIDIVSKSLQATGLELNIRFAPAMINQTVDDYNMIYPFTIEEDKDIYGILEELLSSLKLVLYQCEGIWIIEGLNIREQRVYTAKTYDFEGNFISDKTYTRNYKYLSGIDSPLITMQPPYGNVIITHDLDQIELPRGLSSGENLGWETLKSYKIDPQSVSDSELQSTLYANEWFGTGGFFAYYQNANKIWFSIPSGASSFGFQNISFKHPVYIQEGVKYNAKITFEIDPTSDDEGEQLNYMNNGEWQDPFNYRIYYENISVNVLRGNDFVEETNPMAYLPLNFAPVQKEITIDFDFTPSNNGLFDIKISPIKDPVNLSDRGIDRVFISNVELTKLEAEEEQLLDFEIATDRTIEKEIDLNYSIDPSGLTPSFRMDQLNFAQDQYDVDLNPRQTFTYRGDLYIVFFLSDANLIDLNRDSIYDTSDNKLEVIDVIYNYQRSNDHVVRIEGYTSGDIRVKINKYGASPDRGWWDEWTDSIYKIEKESFIQTHANIDSRLFNKELASILDLTALNNLKFNDFVMFNYDGIENWIITNLRWDLDNGSSEVSIVEKYYAGESFPPVVVVNDYNFSGNSVTVTNEKFDPDGYIVSVLWEELTTNGANIVNSTAFDSTEINNLTEDYYKFRITVTDDSGNTGFDEFELYRINDVILDLTETSRTENSDFIEAIFELEVTPDISEYASLNIQGRLRTYFQYQKTEGVNIFLSSEISQNSVQKTGQYTNFTKTDEGITYAQIDFTYFSINYLKGDVIRFKVRIDNLGAGFAGFSMRSSADVTSAIYNNNTGAISGIPIMKDVQIIVNP